MFTPLHALRLSELPLKQEVCERWHNPDYHSAVERIKTMLSNGAGEDFLQADFEEGRFPFLDDMWDLRGISLVNSVVQAEQGERALFESLNFAHASFYNITFRNVSFEQCGFRHARFEKCKFIDCIMVYGGFFGAGFENVVFQNCDIGEGASFLNCELRGTHFENCFLPSYAFRDCCFDEGTDLGNLVYERKISQATTFKIEPNQRASFFREVRFAYKAGGAISGSRKWFREEMKARTRHNTPSFGRRLWRLIVLEWLSGYGQSPGRVLIVMGLCLVAGWALFAKFVGWKDGLLVASGAFFTNGARSDLLNSLGWLERVTYVSLGFLGVFLMGMFIVVLASDWFGEA